MLILVEGRASYGNLYISANGRAILFLKEEKVQFLQQYPDLTHVYVLTDILTDNTYFLYTIDLKKLLRDGTTL